VKNIKRIVHGTLRVATLFLWMPALITSVSAATWYVDSSVSSNGNGTSWASAWQNVTQITGISAGDTVYISGGPAGQSQTYTLGSTWSPSGGSSGKTTTYQIGQDSQHNGTAIFAMGSNGWLSPANYSLFSGNAGDGKQHFQINSTSGSAMVATNGTNVQVSYVTCPSSNGSFFYTNNGGPGLIVDHVYFYKIQGNSSDDDHFAYFGATGTAGVYDQNLIHDCVMYLPHQSGSPGDGDDGIQSGAIGVSIYNNSLIGYNVSSYPRGQHQDGWQPLQGSYYKYYNNYLLNIGNYAFFGDALYGTFNHLLVYNNVLVCTDAVLRAATPQGIAIGPDGGYYSQNNRTWGSFSSIYVCNNIIVDYGSTNNAINLRNGYDYNDNIPQACSFVNCVVSNNVAVNCGPYGTENGQYGVVAAQDNLSISDAQAAGYFVSFTPSSNSPPNNYNLLSTNSAMIQKGVNLSGDVSSFNVNGPNFTTDASGTPRPATGAWDIGPYQSGSGGSAPTGPAAPSNLHRATR
jgi:hypothetical protein